MIVADHRQQIFVTEQHVFLVAIVELHFVAAILRQQNFLTDSDRERNQRSVLVAEARARGQDHAFVEAHCAHQQLSFSATQRRFQWLA